jgi:epoxyqueuosine reductase
LNERIKAWGRELGFQAVGIADADLSAAEPRLLEWLARGWHGEMEYMARHGALRARPAELKPGTLRVISCRMDYLGDASQGDLPGAEVAFVARYARGRDYHKVLRDRLQKLCDRIREEVGDFGYRVFTDSAPVMEVELAARAGLGWRGKHTLLLSRDAGSWFFLGEIYCDIPLDVDAPEKNRCGTCARCIDVCPTQAIRAPYELDARRCISYLTIEHRGDIPAALRPAIGSHVYGCDICQDVCPWNGAAPTSTDPAWQPRRVWDRPALADLSAMPEDALHAALRGSAMRRAKAAGVRRNVAIALENMETART